MTNFDTTGRTATGRQLFKEKTKKKTEDQPKTLLPAVHLGAHGRYQVKSGRLSGEYIARAFPKPPTNARGLIAEARGETEEAAVAALHDVIDAREIRRAGERRIDADTGSAIPSTEEYIEALGQVALSGPQRAMLMALTLAGSEGLTEMRMANAAGYKSHASANRSFTAAGLLIASYLVIETSASAQPEDLPANSLLGFRGAPPNEGHPGNWILHAELREAVRSTL